MIKGTTPAGFDFELNEHITEDYEVVEALVKYFRHTSYENFVTFKELMFKGAEDCEKRVKEYLRKRDGYVNTKAFLELVFDIWNSARGAKN